jgi:hypothetical protein
MTVSDALCLAGIIIFVVWLFNGAKFPGRRG